MNHYYLLSCSYYFAWICFVIIFKLSNLHGLLLNVLCTLVVIGTVNDVTSREISNKLLLILAFATVLTLIVPAKINTQSFRKVC